MKSEKKKSKSEIIKLIVSSLSNSPKSMYELAKEIGSNWDTIKGNVDLLKELNILYISDNKVFLRADCLVSLHKDVVAGLPLSNDVRKRVYALAKIVCDKWKETVGKSPNNTQLQKSIVEIAEKFPNLRIPRGWYFYGKVVLVKVDQCNLACGISNYDFKQLQINIEELESEITLLVKKFSKMSASELVNYQYNTHNKEDYIIKKQVEKLLISDKLDPQTFANLLYRLIFNFKVIKEDELNNKTLSIIKEIISIMITKASSTDKDLMLKIKLIETFNAFWKLYSTYQLFQTLEGDLGYDKRMLTPVFDDKIDFYTDELTTNLSNLGVELISVAS